MARSAQSARVAPSAEAAAAYIREIEQFLYREAACLDDRNRWQEWLDLAPIERFRQSEKLFAQYLAMGPCGDSQRNTAALLSARC